MSTGKIEFFFKNLIINWMSMVMLWKLTEINTVFRTQFSGVTRKRQPCPWTVNGRCEYEGAQATETTWIHENFLKSWRNTNLRGCFNQFTIRFAQFPWISVDLSKKSNNPRNVHGNLCGFATLLCELNFFVTRWTVLLRCYFLSYGAIFYSYGANFMKLGHVT